TATATGSPDSASRSSRAWAPPSASMRMAAASSGSWRTWASAGPPAITAAASPRTTASTSDRLGLLAAWRDHQLLGLGDGLGGVQPLRTHLGAVHDGVAAVELERVLKVVETLVRGVVASVRNPAVGLQQGGRAEVVGLVPPVAGAAGRAAGAQDA